MVRRMLLTACLLTTLAANAQNTPTIRVDVSLVTLDVAVSDAAGLPVTNLKREDFQILEDGKPQPITAFSPVDAPYSIQLLIDRSGSMQDYWPVLQPAISRLLENLKPQDRVSIGAFDERSEDVALLLDWRDARGGASQSIALDPVFRGPVTVTFQGGGIRFRSKDSNQAIEWAARRLAEVNGRKGAIVFGDGYTPRSGVRTVQLGDQRYVLHKDGEDDGDLKSVQRAVQGSRGRFYFVAMNTDLNPMHGRAGDLPMGISLRARLELLAASSGGSVSFPRTVEDILILYGKIARELGTSYTLGYSPSSPKEGVARRIEVRTSVPALKVTQSRDTVR